MGESRIIEFPGCVVEIWSDYMETRFPNGLKTPAAANFDEQSRRLAAELGYGDDMWTLSKEHELCHTLVSLAQGYPYSRVLLGTAVRAAGGRKEDIISPHESWKEECLILSVQKYLRLGTIDTLLEASGLDLEALAARLREVCGG